MSAEWSEFFKIGIIQTSLNSGVAWKNGPIMDALEQQRAWEEVREAMRFFHASKSDPDLVLLPELSVPRGCVPYLNRIASYTDTIIVAGLDYNVNPVEKVVRNEAIVIIPGGYRGKRFKRKRSARITIGKTYPSLAEERKLKSSGYIFKQDPVFWLLDAEQLGRMAVCICFDLMDIERWILYKQQIHHLLILAYNRDIISFYNIAETLSRVLFCNVVICNTGYFGGSVAISPYYEPYMRTIYRHEGKSIFTFQTIQLPVRQLIMSSKGEVIKKPPADTKPKRMFKSLPPGFE